MDPNKIDHLLYNYASGLPYLVYECHRQYIATGELYIHNKSVNFQPKGRLSNKFEFSFLLWVAFPVENLLYKIP